MATATFISAGEARTILVNVYIVRCCTGSQTCCDTHVQSDMADYAVRAATLDDLEALTHIYNHYVVNTAITFDLRTFAAPERQEWFDDHRDSGPHRLLVATDGHNRCLGYASSSRWRPKPAYNTTVETS